MNLKTLLALTTLCFSATVLSEKAKEPEPLDPKYMGEHEFVIVSKETSLYAYYLPAYKDSKNVQLLYWLNTKNPEFRYLVRDADLVTARTSKFNLQLLMRAETVDAKMKVYMGHLQQGAMPIYESVDVTFEKQLYVRSMQDLKPSGIHRIYDKVEFNKTDVIMVHQIQSAPSYDHLLMIYDAKSCLTEFNTRSAIPDQNQLIMRFFNCGSIKPLYYNVSGFETD